MENDPYPWFGVPHRPEAELLNERRVPADWESMRHFLNAFCEAKAKSPASLTFDVGGNAAWESDKRGLLGALSRLSSMNASWVEGTARIVFAPTTETGAENSYND